MQSSIIYRADLSRLNVSAKEISYNFSHNVIPQDCPSCEQLDYIKLESNNGSFTIWKSVTVLENDATLELLVSF